MKKGIDLSVVLAVHNEENNLARCLNSVANLADEIIVVDGQSTDKTVEIAEKYGAKVIKSKNFPIFHINKQMAMDRASGRLILQLDADEVLDDELKHFILRLKKEKEYKFTAWWIKRKNWFLWTWLKKGGQYPDPVIRLFLRGKASLPQKSVHEQMVVDGDISWAEGHLLHYSNPDFDTYMKKFDTYTSLTADELFDKKTKTSITNTLFFLGVKPIITFFLIFIRHKGFADGLAGLIFAFLSAMHHPVAYFKLWEKYETNKNKSSND